MKWHGLLAIGLGLAGCDPLISAGGTDDGSSGGSETSSGSTSPEPEPDPPLPTTTPPNPTTAGTDPSSTTDIPEGSTSSGGQWGSSSTSGEWGSTSTGGESSTGAAETSGAVFIDPTGNGDPDCDPYLQDCPDGEKCNAYASFGSSWDSLGCFPLDPMPGQPGEACTVESSGTSGIDTCDAGAMCWDVDEDTLEGVCIALCEGTPVMPSCTDLSTSCVISNEASLNLCLPICDPVLQNCPEGQGCYPVEDSFVCAPDASGDFLGEAGDPCEFVNACDSGLGCVAPDVYGPGCPPGSAACCSPFCDASLANTCPEVGQDCVPWFEEGNAPPGFDDVGVCSVPA